MVTDPIWTPQDAATIALAGFGALLATGAFVVSIVALTQKSRYFSRPHFKVYGSTQQRGTASVWIPSYWLQIVQLGPVDAHDVQVWFKPPGSTRWIWANTIKTMPAHSEQSFYTGLSDASDFPIWNEDTSREFKAGPPLLGKWSWRISWNQLPNPNKRETLMHHHRVTQRKIDKKVYNARG